MKPTPQAIENAARAMEPRAFEILDAGYTSQNYFEERAFLNAEKVVKRARKKATSALSGDLGDMVLVPKEATAEMLVAATDLDEFVGGALYTAHPGSVYRAMIAAAEGERCK